MNRRKLLLGAGALAASVTSCAPAANGEAPRPFPMRRGVNLGNALEAPQEGEWGYRIEAAHLGAIAAAGFDGVRLPVRWDQHLDVSGRLSAAYLARVTEVVGWALSSRLKVQLDVHHFDALIQSGPVSGRRSRFMGLWRQIADAFRAAPDDLYFEPLNEPNGDAWTGAALRDLQLEVIGLIRATNPQRLIVLGPSNWQNIDALRDWRPPAGDNIAVSVHYYEPHAFTHQGAEWMGANAPRFDRAWGTEADHRAVRDHIAAAASWGRQRGYAMQLGEFGANSALPLEQRALWTRAVRDACDAEGMAWCAWDFAGAFPVWDRERGVWLPQILGALLGDAQ